MGISMNIKESTVWYMLTPIRRLFSGYYHRDITLTDPDGNIITGRIKIFFHECDKFFRS